MEKQELRQICTCDPLWESTSLQGGSPVFFSHFTLAFTSMLLEQNTVGQETLPNNPHPDLRAAAPRAPAIFTPMRCSRHIPLTRQTSPSLASWLFYPIQSIIKSHLAWWGAAPASCCARNFQLDQCQQNLTCQLWSTAADAGTWSQVENNKFVVQPPGNCDYYQQWVEILCNLLWRPGHMVAAGDFNSGLNLFNLLCPEIYISPFWLGSSG